MSRVWLPNTLASSTPDTERVSSLIALMAASASWVDGDTWRRRSPTALVSQKNAGTVMTATMVSCQLMMIMATMLHADDVGLPDRAQQVLASDPAESDAADQALLARLHHG